MFVPIDANGGLNAANVGSTFLLRNVPYGGIGDTHLIQDGAKQKSRATVHRLFRVASSSC